METSASRRRSPPGSRDLAGGGEPDEGLAGGDDGRFGGVASVQVFNRDRFDFLEKDRFFVFLMEKRLHLDIILNEPVR